jgi:hypothetical protein
VSDPDAYSGHNNHNANHQIPGFCSFINAIEAFDKLRYFELFELLVMHNLPACIIRMLINLQTHNFLRAAWDSIMAD